MSRVKIITAVSPLRAYSGIKYLAEALTKVNVDVEVIAKIPRKDLHETENWPIKVRSFYSNWYGRIPLLRRYMTHLDFILISVFKADVIVFHELSFYRSVVYLKKLFPRKKFIHYCTELYDEKDVPEHKNLLKFYMKYSNIPDLIIECDKGREKLRKEIYNINKPTVVIPNTIPKSEIPSKSANGSLASIAGMTKLPENMPIIIYTGGAYFHRQLDIIVDAISNVNEEIFFLAFCYGEKAAIEQLKDECETKLGKNNYKICKSVPRKELLECIHEATAGIVYYKPSLSIGNLYAAPTKLYEYIAANVPVISSNNPEIVSLITNHHLGSCVKDETIEALTSAIENLVFDDKRIYEIKKNQNEVFDNQLCYEIASKEGINAILKLIRKS